MKHLFTYILPLAFFAGNASLIAEEPLAKEAIDQRVRELIAAISVEDEAARYEPRMAMQDLTSRAGAPDSPNRETLVDVYHQALKAEDTPPAARAWIIRQLEYIGGGESVALLGDLMGSPFHHERELARRALEKNSSEEADAKIRELMVAEHDAALKRALVHVAGERRDADAASDIAEMVSAEDDSLRKTAITALGKIASPEAVEALTKAYGAAEEEMAKQVVADALFESGRRLVKDGDNAKALAIYQALYDYDEPAYIRAAALRGLVLANPEEAENVLILALQSKTDEVRQSAISAGLMAEQSTVLPNVLAVRAADLPAGEQLMALEVLAAMGDESAASQVGALVEAEEAAVRLEAVETLGRLGGLEATKILLETAGRKGGDEAEAARDALAVVSGEAVDAALLAAASEGDVGVRIAAIEALGARDYTSAVPVLFSLAEKGPKAIRQAAFGALGYLAEGSQVGALAKAAAQDPAAGKALLLAARRLSGDAAAREHLLVVFDRADVSGKEALLPSLSVLGGADALGAVRHLLGYEGIGDTAAKALADWSSVEACPILIELAVAEDLDPRRKALWLAGAARLIGSGQLPEDESAKLAMEGLKAAGDTSARSQFLSALGASGSPAAAEPIMSLLDNSETAEEAALAAMSLVRNLPRGRGSRRLARELLEAVVNSDCDKETLGEAKEALRRLR